MKLSADILYSHLAGQYKAAIYGPRTEELTLQRPQFFMDGEEAFLTDHLYLATVEHLPKRPPVRENSVLVCIGENLLLNYYKERMCVIVIRQRADFFKVYQEIQKVFDLYDAWERTILHDLLTGQEIRKLLADSTAVFSGPLYVLDQSFRVIASSETKVDSNWSASDSGSLSFDSLSKFLSASDLMMDRREPIRFEAYGIRTLNVNLFNREGRYEGCLCESLPEGDFREGEDKLAVYLADHILLALENNPQMINDTSSSFKKVLQALLGEMPLSHSQRAVLLGSNKRSAFICIYMRSMRGRNRIPLSYICSTFEEEFSASYAFEDGDGAVAFLDLSAFSGGEQAYQAKLNPRLERFISQMNLTAGISNEFTDLFNIRIHFLQAQSALENGLLISPDGHFFYFSSYALMEMIMNSPGDLPLQAYYPSGFAKLISHDEKAGVSYLETLKVFLEENLSYSAAAAKLYVHRSTLIDRIARIEKELGMDLADPDDRLQLSILLKARELEMALGK